MEQEKVINPGLAIWVIEYNLHKPSPPIWKADGIAFDDYHGFGDNKTRHFDGDVVLLSGDNKTIESLSISSAHFSREGFKWLLREAESLPKPPFLISSDQAMQIIFDGDVEISEEREVIDLSEPNDYVHPVGTRDWFGIMAIKGDNKVHLVAFSPNKDVTVWQDDEVWSFEWDCPVGRIKNVQNFRLEKSHY